MNDIYGIAFFKTFFIEGHQLSLLLVVPLQGAPLARAERVTHGYVGLAFSHKPSHIFFDQSMKLNTDCAFRACFCLMLKHVGIMLEWCLTHFVWQHFGRLFTPICAAMICREVEVGSGSAAARAAGTQRNFQQFQLPLLPPTFSNCKRFPDVSSDFFPQKNNSNTSETSFHCSKFLQGGLPSTKEENFTRQVGWCMCWSFDFGWEEKAGNDILMMNSCHFCLGKGWEPKRSWLRLREGIFVKTDSRPVGADPQICCQHTDSG